MNPPPPVITVRATVKSTYKPISRLHGDDLPKLKRLKKAEFSSSTSSYCLFSRRTLANKLNVWHRQHTHTLDSLRKEQLGVYHVMCRVQKEKRRVQREEHEQLRENIRRLFHRQRKRHMLRRVVAKFRENVQRKRAEREGAEGQDEAGENNQEDHTSGVVQSSVARFKRSLGVSGTETGRTNTDGHPDSIQRNSGDSKQNPEQATSDVCSPAGFHRSTSVKDGTEGRSATPDCKSIPVGRERTIRETVGHTKICESTELKLSKTGGSRCREVHAETVSSSLPVVTLETTKVQRVLPPIDLSSSRDTPPGKPTTIGRDPNNHLITQTDAISHVARVNTPGRPAADTAKPGQCPPVEPRQVLRGSLPTPGGSDRDIAGPEHLDTNAGASRGHSQMNSPTRDANPASSVSLGLKQYSSENSAAETPPHCSSSAEGLGEETLEQRRGRNMVKKLKKEKEKRMQKRAEVLDNEVIVRYSRKPYQDVTPMYGQPKRLDFLPPSRKLNHEQGKLIRAEHQVELEHQVKIDSFFAELFRPKDDERSKFVKKDDESEKPKKATLSLAGVLSGVFSLQLSDAPKGKLTLQDKFRRLQSCQYLRVYQPRRGSSADADKVTSWDTAEKSLRTGFGAFAMKK